MTTAHAGWLSEAVCDGIAYVCEALFFITKFFVTKSIVIQILSKYITTMDEQKLRAVLTVYLSQEDIDHVIEDYNDPDWDEYVDPRFED